MGSSHTREEITHRFLAKRFEQEKKPALGRLTNGKSDGRKELRYDGTPYGTVWSGGKGGDYFKTLPIAMEVQVRLLPQITFWNLFII